MPISPNFGGFAAPDRMLVFDLNDFDETLPGPWEWDVKRLLRELQDRRRETVSSIARPGPASWRGPRGPIGRR